MHSKDVNIFVIIHTISPCGTVNSEETRIQDETTAIPDSKRKSCKLPSVTRLITSSRSRATKAQLSMSFVAKFHFLSYTFLRQFFTPGFCFIF